MTGASSGFGAGAVSPIFISLAAPGGEEGACRRKLVVLLSILSTDGICLEILCCLARRTAPASIYLLGLKCVAVYSTDATTGVKSAVRWLLLCMRFPLLPPRSADDGSMALPAADAPVLFIPYRKDVQYSTV